ncbi:MAG: hypothetical protein HY776_05735 [Actinobacteria bacterium]|nr:hypothetical protein [Actinomycetota bacterium]
MVNVKDIFNNKKSRTIIFEIILLLVLILLFGWVMLDSQPLKIADFYSKEDGFIENASLLFAFLSSGLFIVSGLICKDKTKSKILFLIGLFFFILVGEELSWGGRFFHWKYPVLYGVQINGLHDILFVIRDLVFKRRQVLYLRLIFFSLPVFLLIILLIFRRKIFGKILNEMLDSSDLRFIIVAVISIFISLIFDLHLIDNKTWNNWYLYFLLPRFIEESFELIAAISFMFAGIETFFEFRNSSIGDNN